ncbi:MAG: LuxR C-terminal-related transcriptional regulator [Lentisphaerales bacterium]|nr:LuxR C-terminal-related transcriptional regulator [Lentisphaerales bacterium]
MDFTWIEALAEMTGRQCSEDEQLLIISSFSQKFKNIDQSQNDFMERCRRQIGLSPRLNDVLTCLMDSLSNKEIAEKLGISPHTAKDYVKQVLNHYMVSSKRELLAAIKNGRLIRRNTIAKDASREEKLFQIMSQLISMDINICERRRFFLDQFIKLLGAKNYIWYESEFDPSMTKGPKALNVLTNFSTYQQQLFFEAANDPKLTDPYMVPSIAHHIKTGNSSYLRQEFLDDAGWYESEYTKKYYEPGNVDHPLTFTVNQEGNQHCGIMLYKEWKDAPFNEEERDFMDNIFKRIPWLFLQEKQIDKSLYAKLTARQHKALLFIIDGFGKKELAEHFGISENSANEYIKNIYKTFAVNSYGELMKIFMH